MNSKITVKAYAKLNLFLDITGKLENGYHELRTVMQQIDLHDDVEISVSEGKKITINCDNPLIPCNEKNIAYKAAKAFKEHIKKDFSVDITITKRIPLEGGMGGSSTDGAAVLMGLNEIFGKPFGKAELYEIGKALGADVPFCIHGSMALCTGIGEKFTEIGKLPDCAFVIIQPDFTNNTGTAYKSYDLNPVSENKSYKDMLDGIEQQDIELTAKTIYNVFQKLYNDTRTDKICSELTALGALGACMTGSGSVVFGMFDNVKNAEKALKFLDYPFKITAKPVNNP